MYEACKVAGVTPEIANQMDGFAEVCEMLIPVMPTLTIEGITGTMTWEATGEVSKTPTAVIIHDGAYVGAK
jgi:branched-chain amino acid transport system substrate-binding protein